MTRLNVRTLTVLGLFACVAAAVASQGQDDWHSGKKRDKTFDDAIRANADRMVSEGRQIFRYDTFGDEAFWGDALKLHQAIAGQSLGGVGPGVSPATALAVGIEG